MIHQYKLNGYNIVLDVNSGSVHYVDDVCYDIIRYLSDESSSCSYWGQVPKVHSDESSDPVHHPDLSQKVHSEECSYPDLSPKVRSDVRERILAEYPEETVESVDAALRDIDELVKAGKLFTPDIYEPKATYLKNRHTEVKALCLHVAHTCNLNCEYCFASQGKFHGAKRAMDFLIENSGNHRNLEVDFFGGEPLMNWDVVKGTVEYARSIEKEHGKNFRFTLTTNGVGINDEVIDFVNRECHNVVLSLDGRKEVHDALRKTITGEGSYDMIVPKFQKLVKARGGKNYYMRGTFTHNNVEFTNDLFHMADLGFDQLSMEPVVCKPDEPYALTEEDKPKIFEQYELLAKSMLEREKAGHPITFYHYMIDLTQGPCIYKRISGCGSGTEYFAVTPWGDLYPCHQFVGEQQFKMGDIWHGIDRDDIREEFKMCNVYAREECRTCWARLYCSGGCAANAYHGTGSVTGVYEYGCDLFRKRIECAIMMKVAEAEMEADAPDQNPDAVCESCDKDAGRQ